MLSSITSIWSLPTIWRIAASTSAKYSWVSLDAACRAARARAGASGRHRPAERSPCRAAGTAAARRRSGHHEERDRRRSVATEPRRARCGRLSRNRSKPRSKRDECARTDCGSAMRRPPVCRLRVRVPRLHRARIRVLEQHRHQREGQRPGWPAATTITDSDSGENRYLAVPCSRNTGTNTMQMHSVDRNVGMPTSPAPWTIASFERLAAAPTWRSMFSITTVPLSTRMPTASAKPPSVIVFNVCPPTYDQQHGGDDRQRDRGENDQRQPPVAEEQQDHQRGEAGRHAGRPSSRC